MTTSLPSYLEKQAYQYRLNKARSQSQTTDLPDFEPFAAENLIIQDKTGALVPLALNAVQRDLLAHLTGRDLVLKARQKGVSTVIQAFFYYLVLQGNARTSTLCHEDDLTAELRAMVSRFHDNLPDRYRPRREHDNAKVTTYPDQYSQSRIATVGGTAGSRKGRGGTSTHIHGSEVAFWPDAGAVMAAAMQAGNPAIILESTPNGAQGWFYERCMEALDGEGPWTLHFYPWWVDDEYSLPLEPGEVIEYTADETALVEREGLAPEQIKWRRMKQSELGSLFQQEYPEDPRTCFLTSGESFFGSVEHVFTAPLVPFAWNPGWHYIGGLDFGQKADYTELVIVNASTLEEVDHFRVNRQPWRDMRAQISIMANKWHALIYGEANSMGGTNIELLQSGEPGIAPINLIPFDTTPASKPGLIQNLYWMLHEGGLRLQDDPVKRHQLRNFISKQTTSGHWSYEAASGHDDYVIALALAAWGVHNPHTLIVAPAPSQIANWRG